MTKEMLKAERERDRLHREAIWQIGALRQHTHGFNENEREIYMRATIRELMVGSHKGRIG